MLIICLWLEKLRSSFCSLLLKVTTQPQIVSLFKMSNQIKPQSPNKKKKTSNSLKGRYHLKGSVQDCNSSFGDSPHKKKKKKSIWNYGQVTTLFRYRSCSTWSTVQQGGGSQAALPSDTLWDPFLQNMQHLHCSIYCFYHLLGWGRIFGCVYIYGDTDSSIERCIIFTYVLRIKNQDLFLKAFRNLKMKILICFDYFFNWMRS